MSSLNFRSLAILGLIVLMGAGCTTQPVQQSQAFSEAGIVYAEAMDRLMKTTIDVVVEKDSRTLLYIQNLTKHADKKKERKILEKYLFDHDREIKKQLAALNDLHRNARQLKRYFINLGTLANADVSNAAAQSVGQLSDAINVSNKKLTSTHALVISAKEKKALSSVAGFIASSYKSAQLRQAIKKDAEIISRQLLLHEKMVGLLAKLILQSQRVEAARAYTAKVARPYKKKDIKKESIWKKIRKDALISSFHDATLVRAQESAQQMRHIWHSMVENKTDIASIKLFIQDVNEIVSVADQVKAALNEGEATP